MFLAAALLFVSHPLRGEEVHGSNAIVEFESRGQDRIQLLHDPFAAASSSDSKTLATGDGFGSVTVWNLETKRPLQSWRTGGDVISALAFLADDRVLAAGHDDGLLSLHDAETGERLMTLSEAGAPVSLLATDSGQQMLFCGRTDGSATLWAEFGSSSDQMQPSEVALPGKEGSTSETVGVLSGAAFSSDLSRLAIVNRDGGLFFCAPGETNFVSQHSDADALAVAWVGGINQFVTGGRSGKLQCWDAEAGERVASPPAIENTFIQSAFTQLTPSPVEGLLACGHVLGRITIWNLTTGARPTFLEGCEDDLVLLAFPADGSAVYAVSFDRKVRSWNGKLPKTSRERRIDGPERLWTLAVSADGETLYAGGRNGLVAAWNAATGEQLRTFEGFSETVDDLVLSPDGSHLAACGWRGNSVAIWSLAEEKPEPVIVDVPERTRCVTFLTEPGTIAVGGESGTVRIYTLDSPDSVMTLKASELSVHDLAVSPDGKTLAACSGDWRTSSPGEVVEWTIADWNPVQKRTAHEQAIRAIQFSPDGRRIVTAGGDGRVLMFPRGAESPIQEAVFSSGIRTLDFAPNGRTVALGLQDGTVSIVNVETGAVVQSSRTEDDVFCVRFDPSGRHLYSVSGTEGIEVWPVIETDPLETPESGSVSSQSE